MCIYMYTMIWLYLYTCSSVLSSEVSSFAKETQLLIEPTYHHQGSTGLFWEDTGLFWENTGLFLREYRALLREYRALLEETQLLIEPTYHRGSMCVCVCVCVWVCASPAPNPDSIKDPRNKANNSFPPKDTLKITEWNRLYNWEMSF